MTIFPHSSRRFRFREYAAGAAMLFGALSCLAGTPEEDWQRVVELDAGPQVKARTQEEARQIAMQHLDRQEKAIRDFVAAHAQDEHAFEAKLRLVRVLRIRADFQNSEKARSESRQLLDALEKTATPEQRVEVDFTRVTNLMRSLRFPTQSQREELLSAARKFQTEHPADRRVPALLVEVATLFDAQPKAKRGLLIDAQAMTSDPELKARIADDLKRIDLLGGVVALTGTALDGSPVDVAQHRGKVVAVIFFANWSPPSLMALEKVQKAIAELPKDRFQVVGVSLDSKPEELAAAVRQYRITWPVIFDGKGWASPSVRSFGINALPTVWLLDAKGRLQSLNSAENPVPQIRQLLGGR